MLRSRRARAIPLATRPPPDDHASMIDLWRTKIVSRVRSSCRAARMRPGTMRKFSLDFIWTKVQPEVDRNANAKRSGFPIPNLIGGTRLSVPHRSLRRRSSQWNSRGRTLSLRGRTLWSLQPYIGRWLRNIIALPVWAGHPNPANSTRAWKQNFRAKLIGALGAFYYSGRRCRCGHGVGRIHSHRDIEPHDCAATSSAWR
jgi:hypothetical protein